MNFTAVFAGIGTRLIGFILVIAVSPGFAAATAFAIFHIDGNFLWQIFIPPFIIFSIYAFYAAYIRIAATDFTHNS